MRGNRESVLKTENGLRERQQEKRRKEADWEKAGEEKREDA
jgi:hypothetical protein